MNKNKIRLENWAHHVVRDLFWEMLTDMKKHDKKPSERKGFKKEEKPSAKAME